MKKIEYEITKHEAETFDQLTYFCSEAGKCKLEQITLSQMNILNNLLNERGKQGWEMIQLFFGKDGIIVFWKREIRRGSSSTK
ncbi:MAG: hypothetical protein SVZ03_00925 [Spirochaetota bacterium]|nr:hypothetical protein [Spirochaetota bacterium]